MLKMSKIVLDIALKCYSELSRWSKAKNTK